MNAETTKYLLNQQRIEFKENWENELKGWDWDDKFWDELIEIMAKDRTELDKFYIMMSYLYGLTLKKDNRIEWMHHEHIYYNLMNQKRKDQEQMFEDIKERVNEVLEDERLYANGEL
jgi:hypothetical protein